MITNLTGADQVVAGPSSFPAGRSLRGFSVRETTGTARAVVRFWDGSAAGGTMIDVVSLAPGESVREDYVDALAAPSGLFVQVLSGAVEGSVRYE